MSMCNIRMAPRREVGFSATWKIIPGNPLLRPRGKAFWAVALTPLPAPSPLPFAFGDGRGEG